jgi:hypothetical protein
MSSGSTDDRLEALEARVLHLERIATAQAEQTAAFARNVQLTAAVLTNHQTALERIGALQTGGGDEKPN